MAPYRFRDELVLQRRRFTHLAALRMVIAVGYIGLEAVGYSLGRSATGLFAGAAFAVYGLLVLLFRNKPQVRHSRLVILTVDLVTMAALVLLSGGYEIGVSLLMFYFLVTEAALLHGAREVLAITSVSVVFYAAWLASGEENEFRFSFSSFMFMLVVGGALGYYFTYQAGRAERRISERLQTAVGASEKEMVAAVESALRDLALWLGCSRAILAFWDSSVDYYAICQHPPERGPSDAPPLEFDNRHEWACLAANRLDFYTNDVSLTDDAGRRLPREYDLHPYVIQKFEIYNAVGCGLPDNGRFVGRLLLINRVRGVRPSDLKKLQEVSRLFRDVVRHLLVVRRTEQEAYERERVRIAHDLHDGPLQSVISFEMRLQIIKKLREKRPEMADQELASLEDLSRKLVSDMRTFVHRMRPIEADDSSLAASARKLVEGFQKESGIAVTLLADQNGQMQTPRKISGEVLKIAREALHNIYKHSQATHVLLALELKNGDLHLAVDDNGSGFRFAGRYNLEELDAMRLGPKTIKQRVRGLGGELTLESNPGNGANLRIQVPLNGVGGSA